MSPKSSQIFSKLLANFSYAGSATSDKSIPLIAVLNLSKTVPDKSAGASQVSAAF
jgi:hypothetical protein